MAGKKKQTTKEKHDNAKRKIDEITSKYSVQSLHDGYNEYRRYKNEDYRERHIFFPNIGDF